MPTPNPDPDHALRKMGQHIRAGWAKQHPISERSLQTVRDAVRDQWEKEQAAEREKKPAPDVKRDRHREPGEPEP